MRRTTVAPIILAAVAFAAWPPPLAAQDRDFSWRGRLASGKRLEVKGVNGDVRAVAASGNGACGRTPRRAP
ncbi:MAG: hypothetical protein WD773_07335 [Gemmatimonadales bacterium]